MEAFQGGELPLEWMVQEKCGESKRETGGESKGVPVAFGLTKSAAIRSEFSCQQVWDLRRAISDHGSEGCLVSLLSRVRSCSRRSSLQEGVHDSQEGEQGDDSLRNDTVEAPDFKDSRFDAGEI
jgi:hypothetical protein